jgi:hypothetical protein
LKLEIEENKSENAKMSESQQIDFTGLVLGLSGAALSYLGHLTQQDQSTGPVNLDLAKQNIDILRMLQEKTKGNLNSEEDRILRQVVADLQVRFVESCKFTKK